MLLKNKVSEEPLQSSAGVLFAPMQELFKKMGG
jgi:hypothetical protein